MLFTYPIESTAFYINCVKIPIQIQSLHKWRQSHLLHLCSFSPLCVFKCVLKLVASAYLHCHIGCICLTFLLKLSAREEAKSHWLHLFNFSTVCFQMSPQIVCTRGCIVTLVTIVWPFCTVCFQMSPQISCLIRYKITHVAFVWFSSLEDVLSHCWRMWNVNTWGDQLNRLFNKH